MSIDPITWDMAGERGLRISLARAPSASTTAALVALKDALIADFGSAIEDTVLAYQSLTVFWPISAALREPLKHWLSTYEGLEAPSSAPRGNIIRLPVWYAIESGPDIESLARRNSLTIAELIELHAGRPYRAYANGFAPGFCYLGEVDERLACPRHATPRQAVATGSVGIADTQTAVYPRTSPGGWQLIGRCPIPLFDLNTEPPTRINVGDTVIFDAIDRERFIELGGCI